MTDYISKHYKVDCTVYLLLMLMQVHTETEQMEHKEIQYEHFQEILSTWKLNGTAKDCTGREARIFKKINVLWS